MRVEGRRGVAEGWHRRSPSWSSVEAWRTYSHIPFPSFPSSSRSYLPILSSAAASANQQLCSASGATLRERVNPMHPAQPCDPSSQRCLQSARVTPDARTYDPWTLRCSSFCQQCRLHRHDALVLQSRSEPPVELAL